MLPLRNMQRNFCEIDNPGTLDWSNYSVPVSEGEIVAFRSDHGYALVKIIQVFAGDQWGHDHTALHFNYEIRALSQYA